MSWYDLGKRVSVDVGVGVESVESLLARLAYIGVYPRENADTAAAEYGLRRRTQRELEAVQVKP